MRAFLVCSLLVPGWLLAGDPAISADAAPEAHWAYRAIRRPPIPRVGNASWPRRPLDHFVIARLEAAGLEPSPAADRRTLIRRASFDLIGLAPSYEHVQEFVEDSRPGAFARVVDALLARPEYGERWGRHWLDVARYADTKGYVDGGETQYPFAYTYRDYVVASFNADLPYDRFVVEQIAADRLEVGETNRHLAALGFLTVGHRFNFFPHEVIDDRIDVVTRGFMGLTVSCARCHDHKYDPIPTEDYYSLYGIFANSTEVPPDELPVLWEGTQSDTAELLDEVAKKGAEYNAKRAELHAQIRLELRAWAGDYLRYIVQKLPEHRTRDQAELRTKRGLVRDFSAYARGAVVRWRRYIAECGLDHPVFGIWNRIQPLRRGQVGVAVAAELAGMRAARQILPLLADSLERHSAASLADIAEVTSLLLEETEELWQKRLTEDPAAERFEDESREQLRQALYDPRAPASVGLDDSEDLYTLNESVKVRALAADIEKAYLKAGVAAAPRAMALRERTEEIVAHVFLRGNPEERGALVPRRFPRLLAHVAPDSFTNGSGRLELARAIVDKANPLTARVIVNRVWGWHFGAPLVETPSDFGSRCAPPSHPALLDFLATRLIASAWSLKELHREILLSSTYRQKSHDRPTASVVDPGNRLLWRMNRRRLGFEAMRDTMLQVAGRLERRLGGASIRKAPDDPSTHRRTLYSLVDRERLASVFRVFDFPSPELSSAGRSRTTVPQQALFLLNNPFVVAQTRALVEALDRSLQGDMAERVRWLHRRLYQRDPEAEELRLAALFLMRPRESNRRVEGDAPPAGGVKPCFWWVEYAQALLQANEFLFVD